MIVHVFNLSFDKAVDALSVRSVGETADHAEPVRPLLLSGEQLLDGQRDPLPTLPTHHFLIYAHLGLDE